MTNLLLIAELVLMTNTAHFLHPSGIEGFRTSVVCQCVVLQSNQVVPSFTNCWPVGTNVERMVWETVTNAPRRPRKPLSVPDLPGRP